jgi:hypothetical protein
MGRLVHTGLASAVVSDSTCPPLSLSPHANSFVIGTAVINTQTHLQIVLIHTNVHLSIGLVCTEHRRYVPREAIRALQGRRPRRFNGRCKGSTRFNGTGGGVQQAVFEGAHRCDRRHLKVIQRISPRSEERRRKMLKYKKILHTALHAPASIDTATCAEYIPRVHSPEPGGLGV